MITKVHFNNSKGGGIIVSEVGSAFEPFVRSTPASFLFNLLQSSGVNQLHSPKTQMKGINYGTARCNHLRFEHGPH